MVGETSLSPKDFIYPLFVRSGSNERRAISSMPGCAQISIDLLEQEIEEIQALGIPSVLLFGIPDKKDAVGSENCHAEGIVPQAIRQIKELAPELVIVSDMCFCEYTDHGHCGVINTPYTKDYNDKLPEGYLLNDPTLEHLAKASVVHAEAGADIIAPSGMLDGMIGAIRAGLDRNGFEHTTIMSYSAKYASGFYGPFREAAEGAPQFGDRKQYQMDPGNAREALRETELDIGEGADIVMVKPAMAYLDIISQISQQFDVPVAAYQVSGEYAMLHAAAERGWLDLEKTALESLTAIRRAGAKIIISYFAKDAAKWIAKAS